MAGVYFLFSMTTPSANDKWNLPAWENSHQNSNFEKQQKIKSSIWLRFSGFLGGSTTKITHEQRKIKKKNHHIPPFQLALGFYFIWLYSNCYDISTPFMSKLKSYSVYFIYIFIILLFVFVICIMPFTCPSYSFLMECVNCLWL